MSIIYSTNDYRRNLKISWRQYFPKWTIPKGYHDHHIKPRVCFEDKSDSWNKGLNKNSNHPSMKKMSESLKGKQAPNKGKTYEEIYGEEMSAELKEKRKLTKIKYWAVKKL